MVKTGDFIAGFTAGFKRVNVKKTRGDLNEEGTSYLTGYVIGFLLKFGIVAGAAYYGIPLGMA